MSIPWQRRTDHVAWLVRQTSQQLAFGTAFAHPDGGAAWLGDDGRPDLSRPVHTWISARMAHVYSLGALAGVPGCDDLADVALAGLTGRLHDDAHGGWYASSEDDTKSAYAHAFVLLAASTASVAGRPGAPALLDDAAEVLATRFLTEAGLYAEQWDAAWTRLDPYRGVNANMHGVEATLAAYDATGDRTFLDRAHHITSRVHSWAAANDWRVPEHFDVDWTPMPEYHRDQPDHPFQPYGATVGHGLEWSRLTLAVRAALGRDAPGWMLETAVMLFERAVADGWSVDDHDGFVYTTDWSGRPVVRERMHWVVCEAISAAAALHEATGNAVYDQWYRRWWNHAARHWIDPATGSWAHQLAPDLSPSDSVWTGRPDLYHSLHAVVLPRLPLAPGAAVALREGIVRDEMAVTTPS
ncbi:AGE family epimerase/isomerase [Nocardioides mangrovicus]|uniref:AGE family epimerase/isomerase n=1 Tax=Nocardioides mangrovicus TaxID=2478913 RepID=A0A3L8P7Z9_9ACTN|nr:AGE family epimerase/isomerase [Nocardioides mangrovicus]RLV51092.1 AGE family epimerase/isomerase [Nocardioides mangrovicus]